MTIRKRVKHKWHFTLGDFEFKKATYHPDGRKSFEVWYKKDFIGECQVIYHSKNSVANLEIFSRENPNDKYNAETFANGGKQLVGNIFCTGLKNEFPTAIIKATLIADRLYMISKRKVLIEKYTEINLFFSI